MTEIVQRLNDKRNNTLTYLFKEKLVPQFSVDGRWASILAEHTRVAADVVALDTELPLKSRDSLESATGPIPKMGLKYSLKEKQMKDIDAMIAQGTDLGIIINNIFQDTPKVIYGVWERIEDIFLSELSSGVGLADHSAGTGVRINMNFYPANQFLTSSPWGNEDSTPLTDIQKIVDKAIEDGNTITAAYLDDTALQLLYKNAQVRAQYAFNQGVAITGSNAVPVLDLDKLRAIFLSKWGITLNRVSRTIKTEINGQKNNHKPWKKGAITFVCDDMLGSLVWTNVAEANRPVAGVQYQTADNYILTKKYAKTDPLVEITASEAMVIPILNNVDRIYTLDSQTVQE